VPDLATGPVQIYDSGWIGSPDLSSHSKVVVRRLTLSYDRLSDIVRCGHYTQYLDFHIARPDSPLSTVSVYRRGVCSTCFTNIIMP
jgi:hypothetical protein